MANDKAIHYGKLKRKPYYGAKASDSWCRRKICPSCARTYRYKRRRQEPLLENDPSPPMTLDRALEILEELHQNLTEWDPLDETRKAVGLILDIMRC